MRDSMQASLFPDQVFSICAMHEELVQKHVKMFQNAAHEYLSNFINAPDIGNTLVHTRAHAPTHDVYTKCAYV